MYYLAILLSNSYILMKETQDLSKFQETYQYLEKKKSYHEKVNMKGITKIVMGLISLQMLPTVMKIALSNENSYPEKYENHCMLINLNERCMNCCPDIMKREVIKKKGKSLKLIGKEDRSSSYSCKKLPNCSIEI